MEGGALAQRSYADQLVLSSDDTTRTFSEWTAKSAQDFFPGVGRRTYRVPAVYFNHQSLASPEQTVRKEDGQVSRRVRSNSVASSSSTSSSSSSSSLSLFLSSESSTPGNLFGVDDMVSSHQQAVVFDVTQQTDRRTDDSCVSSLFPKEERLAKCKDMKTLLFNTYNQDQHSDEYTSISNIQCDSRHSEQPMPCKHNSDINVFACNGILEMHGARRHETKAHGLDLNIHLADDVTRPSVSGNIEIDSLNVTPQAKKTKRNRKKSPEGDGISLPTPTRFSSDCEQRVENQSHIIIQKATSPEKQPTDNTTAARGSGEPETTNNQYKQEPPATKTRKRSSAKEDGAQESAATITEETLNPTVNTGSRSSGSRTTKGVNQALQVQIVSPSQESMVRRDRGLSLVLDRMELLGKELEGEGRGGLFIISGVNYDHYLNRVPAEVLRAAGGGYLGKTAVSRGVLDIVVLHGDVGMVVVQVKSVGGNTSDWRASDGQRMAALQSVVRKVAGRSVQLRTDVAREMNLDLDFDPDGGHVKDGSNVLHVLALPYVSRAFYEKTIREHELTLYLQSIRLKALCKEDLEGEETITREATESRECNFQWLRPLPHPLLADVVLPSSSLKSPLYVWWKRNFVHTKNRLPQRTIQEIVGRICGLFSTFTPVPDAKCRGEVRTFGHCVSETAARLSAPTLTASVYQTLQSTDRHVAVCGPPGSGKSMLLMLKAAQWLEQGETNNDHVALVSFSQISQAGRLSDQALFKSIKTRCPRESLAARLHHHVWSVEHVPLDAIASMVHVKLSSLLRRSVENPQSGIRDDNLPFEMSSEFDSRNKNGNSVSEMCSESTSRPREENSAIEDTVVNCCKDTGEEQDMGKLHVLLTDIDPRDVIVRAALQALSSNPSVRSVWWTSSEPLDGLEMGFPCTVREMSHVTRRSLHVQSVMHSLEWRQCWQGCYASSSTESCLPTDGPPVVWIQHRHHLEDNNNHQHQSLVQGPHQSSCFKTMHPTLDQERQVLSVHRKHHHGANGICWNERGRDKVDLNPTEQGPGAISAGAPTPCSKSNQYNSPHQPVETKMKPVLREVQSDNGKNRDTSFADGGKERASFKLTVSVEFPPVTGPQEATCVHSPFSCSSCEESLVSFLQKLLTNPVPQKMSPFYCGQTRFFQDNSKITFGTVVKPGDILILTALPEPKPDQRKSHKKHTLSFLKGLLHSRIISKIKSVIPLKVFAEETGGITSFTKTCAVFTSVSAARGIERNVVVYIPCHIPHYSYHHTEVVPDSNLHVPVSTLSSFHTVPEAGKRSSFLDHQLSDQMSRLDDINRRGLYTAASCCLSQLVVIMP